MAKKKAQRRTWGTLRTLPSGNVRASYTADDGNVYPATHTFATRMDAEHWLANERRLLDRKEWTPPAERAAAEVARTITLREYANRWAAAKLSAGEHTPKTSHLYRELLDGRVLPALGDQMLGDITSADVQAWWQEMGREHATPTRNNHAYQLLKTILNAAIADNTMAGKNPCQVSKKVAKPPKPRKVEWLTDEELDKVAARVPEHYRVAVYVSAWCATRTGELFELRRKDVRVSPDKVMLKIQRQAPRVGNKLVVGKPKSDAGIRDITVPPHVATMLLDHMKKRTGKGPESFVFTTTRGQRLSTTAFTKTVKAGLALVGKQDMHIHDLRHVGGTLAAHAGATTKELMSRLGHETPAMAMRYQIAAAERDVEIAAAMSKLVGK